jgi:hypothetical protein
MFGGENDWGNSDRSEYDSGREVFRYEGEKRLLIEGVLRSNCGVSASENGIVRGVKFDFCRAEA